MAATIYLSGKIDGDEGYKDKFWRAKRPLYARGWAVINPAELSQDMDIRRLMGIDLASVLGAAALFALPDWKESKGATIEVMLAERCGIPVYYDIEEVPDLYDQEM